MMRWIRLAALPLCLSTALAACEDNDGPDQEEFRAEMNGSKENPAVPTTATGVADFEVAADGQSVAFTISVTGLVNTMMAHIHGPASTTQNTGVIVTLIAPTEAKPGTPGTPYSGLLKSGTFTAANLPATVSMDSLLTLMRNGNAYVNVHTNDNAGANNTGPGDMASGEIRGQIFQR